MSDVNKNFLRGFAAGFFWACLLLASLSECRGDNLSDLRDLHKLGLPCASEWNCEPEKFPLEWHVRKVQDGHMVLPSWKLPYSFIPVVKPPVVPDATYKFLRDTNVPVCLRALNINMEFAGANIPGALPVWRKLPLVPESIPNSPCTWAYMPALKDRPFADRFGPVELWSADGVAWAFHPSVKTLQTQVPTPAWVSFVENNEGCEDQGDEERKGGPYWFRQPARNPLGYNVLKFNTPDAMRALSVRMADRVAQIGYASDPYMLQGELWGRRRDQRKALYDGFAGGSAPGWRNIYTAAYASGQSDALVARPMIWPQHGYSPIAVSTDAPGPFIYIAGTSPLRDFTDIKHCEIWNMIPAMEWLRQNNPHSYLEIYLQLSDAAVWFGKAVDRHEVITPERYEAWVQWLLWSTRIPGVPVVLRHWCDSKTSPTQPFFSDDDKASLVQYGAPELVNLTVEDYVAPIWNACDRICEKPLREFWLKGKPILNPVGQHPSVELNQAGGWAQYPDKGTPDNRWRLLDCSENTPRDKWFTMKAGRWQQNLDARINVWAGAMELDGTVLVYACTSKVIQKATVTVPNYGQVTLDFSGKPLVYAIGTPPSGKLDWKQLP